MMLWLGAAAFLLLFGYELLRSATSTLFVKAYGVDKLPIVMALSPLGLLIMLSLYGRTLSALGPRKALSFTSLLSGVTLLFGFGAISFGWKWPCVLLFIFRESYIVLIVEQYWALITSHFSKDTAKKLNGPMVGISSLGGTIGGYSLATITPHVGTAGILWVTAILFVPTAYFSYRAYQKVGEPKPDSQHRVDEKESKNLGLPLFQKYPSLGLLLLVVVASQALGTFLQLDFNRTLNAAYPNADLQTIVSGNFYARLNAVALVLQFLIAPVLFSKVRVGLIHILIPFIALASTFTNLIHSNFIFSSWAFLIFKAVDYSLFKAAKELFYIPFPFDVRYRAKQVIDSFGYRFSKGGTSAAISLLQILTPLGPGFYALSALGASLIWLSGILPLAKKFDLAGIEQKPLS